MTTSLQRIYNAAAYDTAAPAGTYWEANAPNAPAYPALEGDTKADVVIIGAGFTGLSAAYHLAKDHGFAPLVLDAAPVGWGASGRNAGFNTFGGVKVTDEQVIRRHGAEDLQALYEAQQRATQVVADILQSNQIDAQPQPAGEYIMAHKPQALKGLYEDAKAFKKHLGVDCTPFTRDELCQQGIHSDAFHGALHVPVGFGLHPQRYVQGLAQAATKAGASIRTNTPVTTIAKQGDGRFRLTTPRGSVTADKLILAANGYNSENLPSWLRGRFMPVVSHIMVTRPLTPSELDAQGWTTTVTACDTRTLLHYFRLLPDNRFLLGMRGTSDITPATQTQMKAQVRTDFERLFPHWKAVETEYHWSGLVCISYDLSLYLGGLGDWSNAWTALAYHGGGVSMATYSGRLLAGLAAGKPYDEPLPKIMQGPLRRFPLPSLRRHYLPLAYKYYGWKDGG